MCDGQHYEEGERGGGDGGFERLPGLHPYCPPGQVIGILPKSFVRGPDFERPVFKPSAGPPQRLPWRQCVERHVINDQVRRPLARWTDCRPVPAVIIPAEEIERIQEKICSSQKRKEACESAMAAREAERAASYQRHSTWNYTVESLLERKRQEEQCKEEELKRADEKMVETSLKKREKLAADSYATAKRKLLEQKGLIKKFHAAMSMSKQLKDDEELRKKGGKGDNGRKCMEAACSGGDVSNSCMSDTSPDDCAFKGKNLAKKPCSNPAIMQLLKLDEKRVKERNAEIERAKCELREARAKIPVEYSETYLKYIAEAELCDEDENVTFKKKRELQEARRKEYLEEIELKLASHAFIEQHEEEIERQACEFNDYKRRVNFMRKQKEKGDIEEKVKCRMANSELTAKKLQETMRRKIGGTFPSEYDKLKEVWEMEFAVKERNRWAQRQAFIDQAVIQLGQTADIACCKRAALDPSREWEKQCCTSQQDYEKECADGGKRREKAKGLQQYHLCQIADKMAIQDNERCMNAAWGEKARVNYACELKEMQEYAQGQLKEWKDKGRNVVPLKKALKQWEYESGMTPDLWKNTYMTSVPMQTFDSMSFQTTAERLGFCPPGPVSDKPLKSET